MGAKQPRFPRECHARFRHKWLVGGVVSVTGSRLGGRAQSSLRQPVKAHCDEVLARDNEERFLLGGAARGSLRGDP